jgi:phosphoglycerate dehydrogenase-like enzyme
MVSRWDGGDLVLVVNGAASYHFARRTAYTKINAIGREISGEDLMSDDTIGFIGLGAMGRPMAGRLLQHGFRVVGCANRRREAIEALAEEGLHEAANPRAVGAEADILMTIVVDQAQTDQVLRGADGALAAMSAWGRWSNSQTTRWGLRQSGY